MDQSNYPTNEEYEHEYDNLNEEYEHEHEHEHEYDNLNQETISAIDLYIVQNLTFAFLYNSSQKPNTSKYLCDFVAGDLIKMHPEIDRCSVCYEEWSEMPEKKHMVSLCGHHFCIDCIDKCVSCAVCRTEFQ